MTAPARKETISSRVFADLRGAILRGELAPGSKINLDHLRDRFNTSISPLREALARLTADGLVVFEDQRGFRVSSVSRAELDDILALRMTLEVAALREAVHHGGMDWESNIIRAQHRLGRTSATADPVQWANSHDVFHHALIAGTPRALLRRTCAGLVDLSRRYRALTGLSGDGDTGPDTHDTLAEAILRREPDNATECLRRHLGAERAALLRGM
jgi:GntR family transcriptional regulator, carbon starvation induced regulator